MIENISYEKVMALIIFYPQNPNVVHLLIIISINIAKTITRNKTFRHVSFISNSFGLGNTTELCIMKMDMNGIRNLEHNRNSNPVDERRIRLAIEKT